MQFSIDTAYHEAGHAFIAYHFKMPIAYATIKKNKKSVGHVMISDGKVTTIKKSVQWFHHSVMIAIAGALTESIFHKAKIKEGASSDFEYAESQVKKFFQEKEKVDEFLFQRGIETLAILKDPKNWKCIEALVNEFLIKKALTSKEIEECIKKTRNKQLLP